MPFFTNEISSCFTTKLGSIPAKFPILLFRAEINTKYAFYLSGKKENPHSPRARQNLLPAFFANT